MFWVYNEMDGVWDNLPAHHDAGLGAFNIILEHFSIVSWSRRVWCRRPLFGQDCNFFEMCHTVPYYINLGGAPEGVSANVFENSIKSALKKWQDELDYKIYFKEVPSGNEELLFGWGGLQFQTIAVV